MASACLPDIERCLIRGDPFIMTVGIGGQSFSEVVANPTAYQAELVLREQQDDSLTPYLSTTAQWEVPTDTIPNAELLATFELTAAETATLPDFDIVYYAELQISAGAVTYPGRLVQGPMRVSD